MSNAEGSQNDDDESQKHHPVCRFRNSDFVILSGFVIRHSEF